MFESGMIYNGYKILNSNGNIILSPLAEHKFTFIWLHGLGGSPETFVSHFLNKNHIVPLVFFIQT